MKVGFICEGKTEKKILTSERFRHTVNRFGLKFIYPVFDVQGNSNLLPNKLKEALDILKENGAQKIVILTDLDSDTCITFTKNRITSDENRIVIVAAKQIESWFLADSSTLSDLLKENFEFSDPEDQMNPFETLKDLFKEKKGRGIGTKNIFARHMLKYGFSVENAARHPNCPSAAYFLNKLKQLTE